MIPAKMTSEPQDLQNYLQVYYEEIYFDICLVKPINLNKKIKTTSGDQNAGRGDRMAVDLVTSLRLGDQFCGAWR